MRSLGVAAALLVGLSVGAVAVRPDEQAVAQEGKEGRLAALETQVADLQTRVATLEGTGSGAAQSAGEAPAPADGQGVNLTFSGQTDTVTDSFMVTPGQLVLSADYQGNDNFAVWIYGPNGTKDLIFNEIGPYTGQQIADVAGPGDFAMGITAGEAYLEVTGQGPWTITVVQK